VTATKDNIIFDPKPFLYDPSGFGYVDVNVSEQLQYSADFLYRVEAAVSGFAVVSKCWHLWKAPTSTDEKELAISSIESKLKHQPV
jgi:hypothetical protein